MTVAQAAAKAGVSESLVYLWCRQGTLRHLRLGGRGKRGVIRIAPADLDAALAAFTVGQRPPPAASAPASAGSPAGPFSVLNPKRLAKAWKPR